MLPGGLSMMWKLFEAGRYHHLVDSAERLKKEAITADASELTTPIGRFQDRVTEVTESKATREVKSAQVSRMPRWSGRVRQ